MQFSYDCAPKALYDENLISQAKGTMSQSQIDREFNAQFTDDSAGYFKISKMAECTIEDGESPTVEVAGEEGAEYIMAFDPSWSESETSDDFAAQGIKPDVPKNSYIDELKITVRFLSNEIRADSLKIVVHKKV